MKARKTSDFGWGRQKLSVSKVTRGLLSAAIVSGCGSLIGIDDAPPASECIRHEDCKFGSECIEFRCVSSAGGEGGEAGAARGGKGGATAGSAGSFPGGSGEGGDAQGGGAGLRPFATGGGAGRGGTAGHAGEEGGAGGEPPGVMGGAGAGGEGPTECASAPQCLECDQEGRGIPGTECTHACKKDAGCIVPPSCSGLITKCGSNVSCCLSHPVYGGDFNRSCDDQCPCENGPYPANVATFTLDVFEVTVGRFRRFVSEYTTALPETGAGRNPNNAEDVGWRAEWNDFLPTTREAVIEQVTSPETCLEPRSWEQTDERLPMNCVTWYLAQAFCIWDGGRLPTQAEWNYAAIGGSEARRYPWSVPPESSVIDRNYAVYGEADPAPEGPAAVGTHPDGMGLWEQQDLSGNVAEWVLDDYRACYGTTDRCDNCGVSSAADVSKTLMGGGFWGLTSEVTASARSGTLGGATEHDLGFRCARDL
jgi:formylglycine-generating enzyme